MKKHTWSPLAPPRLTLASPGASGGTPPDENVSKNTQKNVFRSIKIRKQISVKKYSEKHLPLQNPLERGGLGGAHLDLCSFIFCISTCPRRPPRFTLSCLFHVCLISHAMEACQRHQRSGKQRPARTPELTQTSSSGYISGTLDYLPTIMDALDIKIFNRKCNNNFINCNITETDKILVTEITKEILKKAATYKKEKTNKRKKARKK